MALCSLPASATPVGHAHAAVSGRVVAVDYGQDTLTVQQGGHRVQIVVVPSTQIDVRDRSGTFADVHTGALVDVFVSEVSGRLVAQIIRLK